jgi:hypothetical protein
VAFFHPPSITKENIMPASRPAETWHIAPEIIDDEIVILNDCNSVIATVPLWQDENADDGLEQQSRQNAALIVTAPALQRVVGLAVEALHTAQIQLEQYVVGDKEGRDTDARVALAEVTAAIAAAKGGA